VALPDPLLVVRKVLLLVDESKPVAEFRFAAIAA
jgi:hypothetical protein